MNFLQLFGWPSLSSKHIWESSQNIDYNEYLMKREINRISVVCESISMPLPGQIEQKRYMLNEMKRLLYCTSLTLFKYILDYVICNRCMVFDLSLVILQWNIFVYSHIRRKTRWKYRYVKKVTSPFSR